MWNFLFQSVPSSQEESMPSLDSMTRNQWTPSHRSVGHCTSPSSRLASLWMEINSSLSRCDLISKAPSSVSLSTISGTSLPICTTAIEVSPRNRHYCSHCLLAVLLLLKLSLISLLKWLVQNKDKKTQLSSHYLLILNVQSIKGKSEIGTYFKFTEKCAIIDWI